MQPRASRVAPRAKAKPQAKDCSKERLKALYKEWDKNKNGKLNLDEFSRLLKRGDPQMQEQDCLRLFRAVDKNHNKVIDFNEFVDYLYTEEGGARVLGLPGEPMHTQQSGRRSSSQKQLSQPEAKLSKYVFDELRSMPTFPPQTELLLQAVLHLLCFPRTDKIFVRKAMSDPGFFDKVKACRGQIESGKVPSENVAAARELRDGLRITYGDDKMQRTSRAVGMLWSWLDGLLASPPRAQVRGQEQAAVSVHHLAEVLIAKMAARDLPRNAKVFEIEPQVIRAQGASTCCPRDGILGAAYVDSVGDSADDLGLAQHMLSYSWSYEVGDIVDTLVRFCSQRELDPKRTYVWLCCLCVNQHRVKEKQAAGEKVPFETFRQVFHSRVAGIGSVIAMMAPWHAPIYITRVWCDFELYTASTEGKAKVAIAMPPRESDSFVKALRTGTGIEEMWRVLGALNVENAQASVAEDRTNILSIIEASPGFHEFNCIVAKFLQKWIVATSESYLQESLEANTLSERDLANLFLNVGSLFSKLGDPQGALQRFEQAKQLVEAGSGKSEWLVPILSSIAGVKRELGDLAGGNACAMCASVLRQDSNTADSWEAAYEDGRGKMAQGDFSGAARDFTEALAKAKAQLEPDKDALHTIWANIGSAKSQAGDLDGGFAAFMEAKEALSSMGRLKTPEGAKLLINLGTLASRRKDVAASLEAYNEARWIFERHGLLEGSDSARLLLNIAIANWNSKNAQAALEAGETALALLEKSGLESNSVYPKAQEVVEMAKQHIGGNAQSPVKRELAISPSSVASFAPSSPAFGQSRRAADCGWRAAYEDGMSKMGAKDFAGAARDFAEALTKAKAQPEPDKHCLQTLCSNLGTARSQAGDLDGSLTAFMEAKEVLSSMGTLKAPEGAKLYLNIAALATRRKDVAASLEAYNEARSIFERHGLLEGSDSARLLLNIAIANWNSQNARAALEAGEAALAILKKGGLESSGMFPTAKEVVDMAKKHLGTDASG